jgi:hypothetical protein
LDLGLDVVGSWATALPFKTLEGALVFDTSINPAVEHGIWTHQHQLLKSSMSFYPIERRSKGFSVKYPFFSGPCIHSSKEVGIHP